jgi:uncharacterized membrane protein YcaP (DUF421 family)
MYYQRRKILCNFQKESLAQDEFFSELRMKSIEHLGQVKMPLWKLEASVFLLRRS